MFLRNKRRFKDVKAHRYFSVVENRRVDSGRVAQRQVLFLGEINDHQQAAWRQTLEVFDEVEQRARTLSLFPEDREIPADALDGVVASELGLLPIYHQLENRVEAHILVDFLSYALSVTPKQRLQALAPGLTPRAVLEKLATLQMLDVCLSTTDGRWLIMPRYTQPEPDQSLMLRQLNLSLPSQPPPRIKAREETAQAVQPRLKMSLLSG